MGTVSLPLAILDPPGDGFHICTFCRCDERELMGTSDATRAREGEREGACPARLDVLLWQARRLVASACPCVSRGQAAVDDAASN